MSGQFYFNNRPRVAIKIARILVPDECMHYQGHFTPSEFYLSFYNVEIPSHMKSIRFTKTMLAITLFICLILPWRAAGSTDATILPAFSDFVSAAKGAQANVVRGVYVPGVLALRVVQQPASDPGAVIKVDGAVTQFNQAARNNVIGLLAHNYLAGASFFTLKIGQEVRIVYGEGRVAYFEISRLARFQVLSHYSRNDNYIDLSSNLIYNEQQIFSMFYDGETHVTFQTCILQNGNSSWGRLFVIASPSLPVSFLKFLPVLLWPDWNLVN